MRNILLTLASFAISIKALPTSPEAHGGSDPTLSTYAQMQQAYSHRMRQVLGSRRPDAKCRLDNVQVRKYWGDISPSDRRDYIQAVACLMKQPKQSTASEVPGARSRYDDFVASHIVEAPHIHYNGHFLAWHRHYTWLYNEALRTECGYYGPVPYWDWTLDNGEPLKGPVFDGSDISFGGNGAYVPHGATYVNSLGKLLIAPAGSGGGCVDNLSFGNVTVNMGVGLNITVTNDTQPQVPAPEEQHPYGSHRKAASGLLRTTSDPTKALDPYNDGVVAMLKYKPRCLTRDINADWSRLMTPDRVAYLLSCPDMVCLEKRFDGWEPGVSNDTNARNQAHNEGHLAIGGLNYNQYASAGDPAFFAHHGMVDRVWAIWQGLAWETRVSEIGGTYMPYDSPKTRPVQASDWLTFDWIGEQMRLSDLGSTIDGPYCYIYE